MRMQAGTELSGVEAAFVSHLAAGQAPCRAIQSAGLAPASAALFLTRPAVAAEVRALSAHLAAVVQRIDNGPRRYVKRAA